MLVRPGSDIMLVTQFINIEHTVSSELQLKLFATVSLDQSKNISLLYLEGENVSTVWPSKCSDSDNVGCV